MCGRFALGIPKKRLEDLVSAPMPHDYAPRYNIAPGQEAVVLASVERENIGVVRRFGLVPHWAKDASGAGRMINARSETVFDKPAFREPVRSARCLVPGQAFYEWKRTESGRQPYAIGLKRAEVLCMAGIMARWQEKTTGEVLDTFAILTCPSNTLIRPIHDRMPVILPPERWEDWLAPSRQDVASLVSQLAPYPADAMRVWPVSTAVNAVAHDGPELLKRVDILRQGRLV